MLKRDRTFKIDEHDEETIELIDWGLIDWGWNSHYWIEHAPGYYKCKWCGKEHTPEMGINMEVALCKENPLIKKLLIEEAAQAGAMAIRVIEGIFQAKKGEEELKKF